MNIEIISITKNPIETIYKAFRVCYSKDVPTEIEVPQGKETDYLAIDTDKISNFIKDKIEKGHESPLEHANLTFAIEGVSRSLSHQLVRHRIASPSQQSQRYVRFGQFDYVIPPEIEKIECLKNEFIEHMEKTQVLYDYLVAQLMLKGRTEKQAIEDARYAFPNAITTNLVWTVNLRNFRHFYAERSCIHAQWEIRELADKMMSLVGAHIPFAIYKAKKCGITCFECKNAERCISKEV